MRPRIGADHFALLGGLLLSSFLSSMLPQNVEAWISSTPPQTVPCKIFATSKTRLHNNLFDGFNTKKNKQTDAVWGTATTKDGSVDDFFANWFKEVHHHDLPGNPDHVQIKTKQDAERAEDYIQNELLDLYKDASVPSHLYDDGRVTAQTRREKYQQDHQASPTSIVAPTATATAARSTHVGSKVTTKTVPMLYNEHPQNPYSRFLEQAEDAIERELATVYTDASVPQHMYDEVRGVKAETASPAAAAIMNGTA